MKLLAEDRRDIASQLHRSLGERLEDGCVPDQCSRSSQGLRHRAVPILGPQSHRPNHFPGSSDSQNHFRATRTQLHDFRATRGQQDNSPNRIAFEENRLAPSKVLFMGRRSNFPTLTRREGLVKPSPLFSDITASEGRELDSAAHDKYFAPRQSTFLEG